MPHTRNDALRVNIERLRRRGLSLRDIAREVEVSHQRVHQIVAELDEELKVLRRADLSPSQVELAAKLRRQCVSVTEIARRLRCSVQTVRVHLRNRGIDTSTRHKTRSRRVLHRETEIVEMRRAGASYEEIAVRYGVPKSLVGRALKNQAPELIRERSQL